MLADSVNFIVDSISTGHEHPNLLYTFLKSMRKALKKYAEFAFLAVFTDVRVLACLTIQSDL